MDPILIHGESGVGKESMAQAAYLLGAGQTSRPFLSVNCPRLQDGNLAISELFGHRKGSFTGAMENRRGCFEVADQGVVFLDEVGDLPMSAQVMMLRTLSMGEVQPLGSESTRRVHVRVVAATNRPLNRLAAEKSFRRDLLFRLSAFVVQIPPLRERGDDWRLLIEHNLRSLEEQHGAAKRFSSASLRILAEYSWPGNVRELISLVTTGYALARGNVIEPEIFAHRLETEIKSVSDPIDDIYRDLCDLRGDFWELVQKPFLDRDLNRREVRGLIARGMTSSHGSYRKLLANWGGSPSQYQKFMDFLRHHRLKPVDNSGA